MAGRAGRTSGNGKVLIQTYEPQKPIFKLIRENNLEKIYEHLLGERKKFHYPPFVKLIFIELKHRREDKLERAAKFLGYILRKYLPEECVLGPEIAPIGKINNLYQFQILLKLPRSKKYNDYKKIVAISLKEFDEIAAYKSVKLKTYIDF